jgi:hypothetical protein
MVILLKHFHYNPQNLWRETGLQLFIRLGFINSGILCKKLW